MQLLLLPLSQLLRPSTRNPIPYFITKRFYKWISSAIKNNASSPRVALDLYSLMHRHSIPFDSFSVLYTLKSCTLLRNLTVIRHLHCHIIKLGFGTHVYVATSLLHAYANMSFGDACLLFDEMPERNTITWNTMITGYSRSGNINKARAFFEEMPFRDVRSWSAMITAYINHGCWDKGLLLFQEMMANSELKPDQVTLGTVLSACARMGFLGLSIGKSVHGFIMKNRWDLNMEIGTVLIDMYSKCGHLKNAILVFDMMKERNVMTWTALICGAAQHGFSQQALSLFDMMLQTNVRPNELTFTGILNACAHSKLVEEGRKYFRMIEEYGLERRSQHYGCMVNLLSKAGLLEEAYDIIETMKFEDNIVVWGSFLSACKEHKKFDIAERVIEQVLGVIKPQNDRGIYSLVCDLYALNGKLDDAKRVRKLMLDQNERKSSG